MFERMTRTAVEFRHAFELEGVEGVQPPGTYDVETVEELIAGLSFEAYRRVSTAITVRSTNAAINSRQQTVIDPADLAAALERDAETSEVAHGRT